MDKIRAFFATSGFILLALAAGCGARSAQQPQSAPPLAPVVRATSQTIGNHLQIASEFRPYQEVDIYAKVSGYVQELNINWGSHVKKGQVLATVEVPELEAQLQRDRAAVRRSDHEVARLGEELKRAESAYRIAHLTYTRLADVQKNQRDLIAQQEIDVAQSRDREASASVSAAQASLKAAEEALVDADAALKKDESLYAYSRIRAPFDGVVTRLDAYSGALLPAATSSDKSATPLCHLSQNNLLRLVIPLPQRVLAEVRVGQVIDVQVETLARKFKGKIALFADQVELATRTMHTEVTVPNPTYELVPGMYASVEIPLRHAENVVTLPVQTVRPSGPGAGTVLVVNPQNRVEERRVTLGIQTATAIEITSGVDKGEFVIVGSQDQYFPGEFVAPKETELLNLD